MWILIALAVLQEPLPGDRQFWLTRPYSRVSLVLAKVLFIFALLNIPLLISDCAILAVQGFPLLPVELLERQILLTILFLLPSFALATIASNIVQFILFWFTAILAVVFQAFLSPVFTGQTNVGVDFGGGRFWTVALTGICCAVVVWQYRNRRATIARIVLLILAFTSFPLSFAAYRLLPAHPYVHPADFQASPIRVSYDANGAASNSWTQDPRLTEFQIPLQVEGSPTDTLVRGSGSVTIQLNGASWPQPDTSFPASVKRASNGYFAEMNLQKSDAEQLKNTPVDLTTDFDFQVATDATQSKIAVSQSQFDIPDVGHCLQFSFQAQHHLTCRSGLGRVQETDLVVVATTPNFYPYTLVTLTSNAVSFGLAPTQQLGTTSIVPPPPGSSLAVIPRRVVARLHRVLELHHVDLTRFTAARLP